MNVFVAVIVNVVVGVGTVVAATATAVLYIYTFFSHSMYLRASKYQSCARVCNDCNVRAMKKVNSNESSTSVYNKKHIYSGKKNSHDYSKYCIIFTHSGAHPAHTPWSLERFVSRIRRGPGTESVEQRDTETQSAHISIRFEKREGREYGVKKERKKRNERRRKIYKLLKKKFSKATRLKWKMSRIDARRGCALCMYDCTYKYIRSPIRCCVDAARADHTRTRKTMKIILKYLFKSTLFIRVIYLFYSFSILFHFIFRIRVRRVSVVDCRWKCVCVVCCVFVWRECVQITVPVTVCVAAGCCWRMYPNPPLHYDYIVHSSHFSSSSPTFFSVFRFVCNSIRVTVENMKQSSKSNREKKINFFILSRKMMSSVLVCMEWSLFALLLIFLFRFVDLYTYTYIFLSLYRDKVSDAVCIHRYKVAESAQILFDVNVIFFKSWMEKKS